MQAISFLKYPRSCFALLFSKNAGYSKENKVFL